MHSALARLPDDDPVPALIPRQVSIVPFPPRAGLHAVWCVDPLPSDFQQWRVANRLAANAIHEAGHAVVMLAFCVPGVRAEVAPGGASGMVTHSNDPQGLKPTGAWNRLACIVAAAVFHSGIEAEKLYGGYETPPWAEWRWSGFPDYEEAALILRDGFARPPHGYVQQVCRAILSRNWRHVETIAAHLITHGAWVLDDTPAIGIGLGADVETIALAAQMPGNEG